MAKAKAKKTSKAKKDADMPFDADPLPVATPRLISSIGDGRYRLSPDLLHIATANIRRTHVLDKGLVASIAAHGQLEDLLVTADEDGRFSVVNGGRRLVAIYAGIRSGELPNDLMVNCRLLEAGEEAARELSLAANLHEQQHPLDTCEAILVLAKTAEDEMAIARHFGKSITWVQQHAKLAGLSEAAKTFYRAGKMDLECAMLMTRLVHVDQDKMLKGADRLYANQVRNRINQVGVDCSVALFDWKATYPPELVDKSLFEDIVMLRDHDTFRKFQEVAVTDRIRLYEAEGYTVVKIAHGDYTTKQKYVTFDGKVTRESKKSLTVIVEPQWNGLGWEFHENYILRKEAKKLEKGANGADGTRELKPKTAKDLSPAQHEILNGCIIDGMAARIAGGMADPVQVQWIVIAQVMGPRCHWVSDPIATSFQGTAARWADMAKRYPTDFADAKWADGIEFEKLTFEAFKAMKPKNREELYLRAVAAMLRVPDNVQDHPSRTVPGSGIETVIPGEAFFNRFNVAQLHDYLKRCGVKEGSEGWPPDSKKSSAVKVAMAVAGKPSAYQFGLFAKARN